MSEAISPSTESSFGFAMRCLFALLSWLAVVLVQLVIGNSKCVWVTLPRQLRCFPPKRSSTCSRLRTTQCSISRYTIGLANHQGTEHAIKSIDVGTCVAGKLSLNSSLLLRQSLWNARSECFYDFSTNDISRNCTLGSQSWRDSQEP